jgi:hypothetical protein
LVSKAAKVEIWSLTPQINIETDTPYLFDNIIQHSSSNLREVSLNTFREYPQIIQHLADHCTKIRVLKLTYRVLETFSTMLPHVARLIDRLTTLAFIAPPDETVILSDQMLANFNALFGLIKHPENLTHLELPFAPDDDDDENDSIADLRSALSRLVNLESIYIPLNPEEIFTGLIFSECRALQQVAFRHNEFPSNKGVSDDFVMTLLQALSNSPIGDRILVTNVAREGFYSFFEKLLHEGVEVVFEWLTDVNFVGPLTGDTVSRMLRRCKKEIDIETLLDALESENRPRWLPSLKDALPHLLRARFWARLSGKHSTSFFRKIVSRVGVPQAHYEEIILRGLYSDQIETMRYLEELGIMTRDNVMSLDPDEANVFGWVTSVEMFEYLVNLLGRENSRSLLSTPSSSGERAFLRYLVDDSTEDLFEACLEWDPTLLRVTPLEDFPAVASFISACLKATYLQSLVDATGWENISSQSRALCLWNSIHGFPIESQFWAGLIEADPSVEPSLLVQADEKVASDIVHIMSSAPRKAKIVVYVGQLDHSVPRNPAASNRRSC